MKKIVFVLCTALIAVMSVAPAMAASKDDILNEVKEGVQVGDKVKKIPDRYVKMVEEFLDANTLTEAQIDAALSDLKDAKETWAQAGETEFKNLPASVQKELQSKAADSAKKVDATLTFDGKTIKVVDANGKTYSAATNSQPIKQTGADSTPLVAAAVVIMGLLAGSAVLVRKYRLIEDK